MSRGIGKSKISEMDKRYFREIFNLHATDDRINYDALCAIFEMVDFKPNEKQEAEFKAMFQKKELLPFSDFLQIFSLKSSNQYNEIDVKNAFRLLSKEYEKSGFIKLDRVKEILTEMGLQDVEILQLTNQLNYLCD